MMAKKFTLLLHCSHCGGTRNYQTLRPAEWLQHLQIASLSSEVSIPMLKMTYLHVLVWAGEGVWSQWQVLRWEVSQEGRKWGRKGRQQLEGRDI